MLFNIVLRQCDIQIGIVVNKLYIYCKETYKKTRENRLFFQRLRKSIREIIYSVQKNVYLRFYTE